MTVRRETVAAGMLFPQMQVLVFLVLPMKMRSFVICYAVLSLGMALSGPGDGIAHLAHLGGMVGGYLCMVRFRTRGLRGFFSSLLPRFKRVRPPARVAQTLHCCAVCGATEESDPGTDFRVCSGCADGAEYCAAHIKEHPHR